VREIAAGDPDRSVWRNHPAPSFASFGSARSCAAATWPCPSGEVTVPLIVGPQGALTSGRAEDRWSSFLCSRNAGCAVLNPTFCSREPGDILLLHRPAFGSNLFDHGGHVDRVPCHHRVGRQVQAACLVPQLIFLLLPERALIGEEQELPQAVERLTLVNLTEDPPQVVLALELAEDEDRLDQAAVLLQGSGQASGGSCRGRTGACRSEATR
jgi:hypothetical protein